jgi:hypothetical protein
MNNQILAPTDEKTANGLGQNAEPGLVRMLEVASLRIPSSMKLPFPVFIRWGFEVPAHRAYRSTDEKTTFLSVGRF